MDELLKIALQAAEESAVLIRGYYGNAKVSRKADTSLVTEADTATHTLLLAILGETGIPILSEEDVKHISLPYPSRCGLLIHSMAQMAL